MFVLFLTGMALIKYGLGLPSGHSGCSFVYVFVPGHLLSDDSIRGKVPLAGPDLFSLSDGGEPWCRLRCSLLAEAGDVFRACTVCNWRPGGMFLTKSL